MAQSITVIIITIVIIIGLLHSQHQLLLFLPQIVLFGVVSIQSSLQTELNRLLTILYFSFSF